MSLLNSLARQFDSERALIEAPQAVVEFATPLDVYRDLVALHDEFPFVSWNTSERAISVKTEPVTLKGVELGAFQIRLHWESLDRSHAYETIPIDANPAASDKSIPHPHVQDGTLCEGEGRLAIGQALATGRLLDFFLIIRSLLTTYNSSGAYVHLENWSGVNCPDCGDLVSAEAIVTCQCGRHEACESCSSMCTNCNETVCSRCSEVCSKCGDLNCTACIASCESCGATICSNCHNSGRCDSCEKSNIPSESQAIREISPSTPPAF